MSHLHQNLPELLLLSEGGDPDSLVKKKKTKRMRTTFTEEQIQILQVTYFESKIVLLSMYCTISVIRVYYLFALQKSANRANRRQISKLTAILTVKTLKGEFLFTTFHSFVVFN